MALVRWVDRALSLDVQGDLYVVAICEDSRVRSGGWVPITREGLRLLAESLLPTDRAALQVTARCREVARVLEPFVDRVVVVRMTPGSRALARRPTNSTLAHWRCCCGGGELDPLWMPDERCRVLRRRRARRGQRRRQHQRAPLVPAESGQKLPRTFLIPSLRVF
jgi:hypothetical protein